MSQQLQEILSTSELEKSKCQILLDNFSNFFSQAAQWEAKAKTIKVTDESQTADMKLARVGRLELRQMRISVEKKRKELKEQSLREGKAIDGIANALKAAIIPIEEYLDKQENFIKIQEQQKAEADRLEKERIYNEQMAEENRLNEIAFQRREKALPYSFFWDEDGYNFRDINDKEFDKIMNYLKKRKSEYEQEQEKIRLENEKLKEQQSKIEDERRRVDEERKAEKAQQAKKEAEMAENQRIERLKAEQADKENKAIIAEAERKKAELEEQLKNQVTCPHCGGSFHLNQTETPSNMEEY